MTFARPFMLQSALASAEGALRRLAPGEGLAPHAGLHALAAGRTLCDDPEAMESAPMLKPSAVCLAIVAAAFSGASAARAQSTPQGIVYQVISNCAIDARDDNCAIGFRVPDGYLLQIQTLSVVIGGDQSSQVTINLCPVVNTRTTQFMMSIPANQRGATMNLTAYAEGKRGVVYMTRSSTGNLVNYNISISGLLYRQTP